MLGIGEFFSKGLIIYVILLIFSGVSLIGYNARKRKATIEKMNEGKTDPFEHLKGSLANKSLSSIVSDNQTKADSNTESPARENRFINIDKL